MANPGPIFPKAEIIPFGISAKSLTIFPIGPVLIVPKAFWNTPVSFGAKSLNGRRIASFTFPNTFAPDFMLAPRLFRLPGILPSFAKTPPLISPKLFRITPHVPALFPSIPNAGAAPASTAAVFPRFMSSSVLIFCSLSANFPTLSVNPFSCGTASPIFPDKDSTTSIPVFPRRGIIWPRLFKIFFAAVQNVSTKLFALITPASKFSQAALAEFTEPSIVVAASFEVVPVIPICFCTTLMAFTIFPKDKLLASTVTPSSFWTSVIFDASEMRRFISS